jgi:ABC-type transport system involved in multi-copper enzyme maturation permease subunit
MKLMSSQFKTVYINTFQKEVRNKSILFLLALTIVIIFIFNSAFGFFSGLLEGSQLPTDGAIGKFPLIAFYTFLESWSVLIAVALGVSIVQSDEESNVMPQLLSFPIKRWEYLLARILGGWSIVVLYYLFSIAFAQFLFSMSAKVFLGSEQIIFAVVNSSLIVLPAICLSVFFTFFANKIIAFIMTFLSTGMISWANLTTGSASFSEIIEKIDGASAFAAFIHYFFPRVGVLNGFTNQILQGKDLGFGLYTTTYLHYVGTIVLFFLFIGFIFKRKDF